MTSDVAKISVITRPSLVGDCELCVSPGVGLASAVVIHHSRGGTVRFAACDRCALAMRRVAAAAGPRLQFEGGGAEPAVTSSEPVRMPRNETIAEPELIHEYSERLRDADDTLYRVLAYGQPRDDRTWIGWLEFVPISTGATLRTDRETTQSSRDGLAYWASGLETAYLEGAFRRAVRGRAAV
jgi:hypothetical protein